MKDRSDDPSHHERMLLSQSYISLYEGSIRRPIAPWTNALITELHLAPWRIDPTTHRTMNECSYHRATSRSMKDRSDDPSHHELMLLSQSYISLHEGSIRRPIAPWTNALTTELHLAPWRIDPTTHRTMNECSYHRATSRSMKDRSDDPSHHELMLLSQSYISLHEGSIRRPIAPWTNALTTELHLAPWRIDPTTHRTMNECSYHRATSRSMKDRSDDPSHHERMLLPQSYISLHHEGSIRRPIAPWTNALTTELYLAPWRIDPTTHRTMNECSYHRATSRSMKDRSDDPSHHERMLLPQSYISLHEGSIRRPIAPWTNALTTELHLAPWRIDPTTHRTMNECSYHRATSRSTMKDRSDDPSHHERMLLPQSYISLHEGSIRRPIAPWTNALTTELHLAPYFKTVY